jgi:hypothetical protein
LQERESIKLTVRGPAGEPVLLAVRKTRERDAANLLAAAGHVANLLDAPVRVSGQSREGAESFRQTLDALRALAAPPAPESIAA